MDHPHCLAGIVQRDEQRVVLHPGQCEQRVDPVPGRSRPKPRRRSSASSAPPCMRALGPHDTASGPAATRAGHDRSAISKLTRCPRARRACRQVQGHGRPGGREMAPPETAGVQPRRLGPALASRLPPHRSKSGRARTRNGKPRALVARPVRPARPHHYGRRRDPATSPRSRAAGRAGPDASWSLIDLGSPRTCAPIDCSPVFRGGVSRPRQMMSPGGIGSGIGRDAGLTQRRCGGQPSPGFLSAATGRGPDRAMAAATWSRVLEGRGLPKCGGGRAGNRLGRQLARHASKDPYRVLRLCDSPWFQWRAALGEGGAQYRDPAPFALFPSRTCR